MSIDQAVIQAAADLIANNGSENLPIKEQAEFSRLDAKQAEALETLLDWLGPSDLYEALSSVAERLSEDQEDA